MLDNDKMERIELRVVNGKWSDDGNSRWQSIFDWEQAQPNNSK